MQQEFASEELQAAVKALTARPALPAHLDGGELENLPSGPGVYLFYGENDLPLYVGKSKTLRKRVMAHFAADVSSSKEMNLAQQVKRIDFIATAGEVGALLTEARLVKSLQPTMNRQLRRNDEVCAWRISQRPESWTLPTLVLANDPDFGRQADLFGLFKSTRDATAALRALADEHGLCHVLLGLERQPQGRPCFSHQLHRCRGACVGSESLSAHALRAFAALAKIKLMPWPFPGRAMLREGNEIHVLDAWCHVGTAHNDEVLHELRELGRQEALRFDRDVYLILRKQVANMAPL
jgi:DNA polymerase-3 subunit epsilon